MQILAPLLDSDNYFEIQIDNYLFGFRKVNELSHGTFFDICISGGEISKPKLIKGLQMISSTRDTGIYFEMQCNHERIVCVKAGELEEPPPSRNWMLKFVCDLMLVPSLQSIGLLKVSEDFDFEKEIETKGRLLFSERK